MSQIGTEKPKEYSDEFDKLRQNRVELSYYKYGSASINFGCGLVNALETHELCIKKYLETGNREYLLDAANYLMFEFMYPQARRIRLELSELATKTLVKTRISTL